MFLSPLPLYFLSFSFFSDSLLSSALAWDSERKVALELCVWSLVELICWDRLQWEKIVYPSFPFLPFLFCFFNPGHFSREKWLPSLFCCSSLNQGNRKILENVAVTVFVFLWSCGRLHCHVSFSVTDCYMCTSLCGLRLSANVHTTAKRAILNQSDSILDLMCNLKSAGPSSAQRHDHETSFGQRAQAERDIRLVRNLFKACQHRTSQPAFRLKNHNLHGAINQPITPLPFVQSEQRTAAFSGDFTCQGCQMDLDRKPWQLCDWRPLPANHECVIWERETYRGGVPGHLYNSWQPQTPWNKHYTLLILAYIIHHRHQKPH